MSKKQLHKEAYKYLLEKLSSFPILSSDFGSSPNISLCGLMLLKEGLARFSTELAALLKQLLRGSIVEAEIDARPVVPFDKR